MDALETLLPTPDDSFELLAGDLDMIETADLDLAFLSDPLPSPETHSAPITTPSAKPLRQRQPRRAYCHYLKEEKACLRARIAGLQLTVNSLLTKWSHAIQASDSTPWRDVALRQQRRRARAEDENKRLRAKLLQLTLIARSLEEFVGNERLVHLPPRPSELATDVMVDQFLAEIARAYGLVDEVTPSADWDPRSSASLNSAKFKSCNVAGRTGRFAELRHSFRSPFAFNRVVEATWEAATTEYARQNREISRLRCTGDVYAGTFRVDDSSPRGVIATIVVRRFIEPGRMVVVWRGLHWSTGHEDKTLAYTPTTGWLVVRPFGSGIVGHVCSRLVPESAIPDEPLPRDFTMVSLAEIQDVNEPVDDETVASSNDIFAMAESMENILMDQDAQECAAQRLLSSGVNVFCV